jgi:Zn-dependent metalloprotease
VAALRQLETDSESLPDLYFQNGFPRFVSGGFRVEGADAVERARNFLDTYQDLYRIANPDLQLGVRRVSEGEGETYVVFYQTYRGIEVFASEIVVTLNGDSVSAAVGGLLNGDVALDTIPTLFPTQAEEIARADLGLPDTQVGGTTTLMVFDQSMLDDVPPEAHLVWRVNISEPAPWQVFVDAHTDQVLFKYSLTFSDFDFEEWDTFGNWAGNTACYWSAAPESIGTEDGLERSYHGDGNAVSAWWNARGAYDFYRRTFSRDSYDNDGSQIEVGIHPIFPPTTGNPNATWNDYCETIDVGDGMIGFDVLVHEMAHGVISETSELIYSFQSGALNESYADVMASLADPDWLIGEDDTGGGAPLRDMSDPPRFGQPDRMPVVVRGIAVDSGGVHTNSGITNKAAYLIAAGDTFNGWSITGIGARKMGALFYATMINLGSGSQMIDARNATVARAFSWAASGAHDFTLLDACQVQNAYAAVGLGDGDTDCDGTNNATDTDDDRDYIPDSGDNCPLAANPGQQDIDGDGQGDACDADDDGDGALDTNDNCALLVNLSQLDRDGDGIGDVCDDDDGDGVPDATDNCPEVANSDQYNFDRDETGNACDTDDDNDTLPDATDNCPRGGYGEGYRDQTDRDGDGVGDYCDNSDDVPNPDQAETDGDTIADVTDNCPTLANFHQEDSDRDGIGDRCDGDQFFDLIPDGSLVDISIRGGPGQLQSVPIPVCLSGKCPDGFPPDYLVSIVLTGLSPNVQVRVIDDTGKNVDRSPYKDDLRVLRFHPNGGRIYHLLFLFDLGFPEGGQAGFLASMDAGPAEEQPNPTPEGPAPAPLPEPPALTELGTTETIPTFTLSKNAFCRKGPSTVYDDVTDFLQGQSVQIDGRNQDKPRWWWVLIPGSSEHCWVSDSAGSASGPLDGVKVVSAPPLPPTATPSPVPEESQPTACATTQADPKACD